MIQDLRTLERLEIQLRYLERHCYGLLLPAGTRSQIGSVPNDAVQLEQDDEIRMFGEKLLSSGAIPGITPEELKRVQKTISAFRLRALKELDIAHGRLFFSKSGSPASTGANVAWLAHRRVKIKNTFPVGLAGLSLMLFCHNLLLFQLASWQSIRGRGKKGIKSIRKKIKKYLDRRELKILGMQPKLGDKISGFFAFSSLRWLLGVYLAKIKSAEITEETIEDVLDVEVKAKLKWEFADDPFRLDAPRKLNITTWVKHDRELLQEFYRELDSNSVDLEKVEPLRVGTVGRTQVNRFLLLESQVLDVRPQTNNLEDFVQRTLDTFEKRLFEAMAFPRPALLDRLLSDLREEYLLLSGENLPLSSACLKIVIFCYGILLSEKTGEYHTELQKKEIIKKTLQAADLYTIFLLLQGMKRILAQESDDSWQEIFDQSSGGDLRENVLFLAALSPLVRIMDRELEEALDQEKDEELTRWRNLPAFLAPEIGGVVRDYALRSLLQESLSGKEIVTPRIKNCLMAILDDWSVGGLLMAGEFLLAIFKEFFSDPDLRAYRGYAQAERIEENYEAHILEDKRKEALARFRVRFFPEEGTSAIEDFFALLATYTAVRSGVERDRGRREPGMQRVRRIWYEISMIGTQGLSSHLWEKRPRFMLRAFWLKFCHCTVIRCEEFNRRFNEQGLYKELAPSGLLTGSRSWDDVAEMGCRLFFELEHALRVRKRLMDEEDSNASRGGTPPNQNDDDEGREFEFVGSLLREILEAKDGDAGLGFLPRALLIRGFLVPDKNSRKLVVNEAKFGVLASK